MNYKNSEWSNAKGHIMGLKTLLRRNESLLHIEHKKYPYLILVNLIFNTLNEDKIPCDDNEISRADITEENIADNLYEKFGALFALSVTREGSRDLFFFLEEPVDENILDSLITSLQPSIDYSFNFIQDPNWGPYFTLYEN